nr:hypothetical protein [Tanacetum cinerariifolium]
KPKLYDGCVIEKCEAIVVLDTEETLMLAEVSRSKMIEKQNDPQMIEKKVITKPINYAIINQLSTDFETRFVPQTESSAEQTFWSQYSVQTDKPNLSGTTIVEVPKELPKVSMVNSCLKKLKFHLASFDMVVKERTTATAITEGTWGFKHTKACFRDDIIPFVKSLKELFISFYQCLIDEAQAKDSVILKLKEKLNSLNGDVKERKVKRDVEEIVTLNIELDHKVTKLAAENEYLKQTYKQLYDSIKSLREKVLVITDLKVQLNKLKGKAILTKAVSLNPIDPELLKVDVAPLVPKLRKNRTAHTDYIRHTQEEAALREIIESERLLSPLNTSLVYAYSKATSFVINSVTNVNSNMKCALCNGCLLSDNHDACVVAYINSVNASKKSKSVNTTVKRKVWKTTGKVFKSVGHIWKPTGWIFTLVRNVCPLTRIATPTIVPPREPIPIVNSIDKPVVTLVYSRKPKTKKVSIKMEPYNSWGSSSSNVPFSLFAYRLSKSSSGQFCDSDVEVAFRQHTCFIHNLDGVDLLTGSQASKTKSWLWHRRLSHLNFGTINHLARQGLVRDLCRPMRVESINGKKYILVIVDDYSRFTWVKFLRSKDETPDFIIKFLKMIQVRLKVPVYRIQTDNGTEFINLTLRDYNEEVGISHETSVGRSPQQNGVVERRNRTLIEAARTMLIYTQAPLFLWAEAMTTACFTQNHSIIRLRHGKTPYELLHSKLPDLSFF